jgi:hypothetical protein
LYITLKLDPLSIIAVIINHVLVVVVGRVEVAKHSECLNLRPPSPGSNHPNIKATVADAMLTPTTTEGVGSIEGPG